MTVENNETKANTTKRAVPNLYVYSYDSNYIPDIESNTYLYGSLKEMIETVEEDYGSADAVADEGFIIEYKPVAIHHLERGVLHVSNTEEV